MEYPKSKPVGIPSPYDKLVICDKCQKAEWTIHSNLQNYCYCRTRRREATKKEYAEELKQRVK